GDLLVLTRSTNFESTGHLSSPFTTSRSPTATCMSVLGQLFALHDRGHDEFRPKFLDSNCTRFLRCVRSGPSGVCASDYRYYQGAYYRPVESSGPKCNDRRRGTKHQGEVRNQDQYGRSVHCTASETRGVLRLGSSQRFLAQ